jgi:tetratricopeptide (TPR) repeat protein
LLDLSGLTLGTVFPVFRNYYDDHALGKVTLKNTSNQTARDIKVSLSIKQYMDGPKESPVVDELRPGQSVDVNLFALFQNAILDVTEATKSTAVVSVRYRAGDEDALQEQTATVRVFDRNAMTWDDDRKAAAFVSGKDPWVLELSNQMTAAAKTLRNPGLDQNLQTVLLFHEGLRLMGLSYVTNPKSPFSQTFAHPETVDFLKFPRQTLSYKAGDCSDLSILYASFFESVGLETAFITVPGHIYMAVKLGVSPEQASQSPVLSGRVIIRNEAVWLPIETTMREARFTDAWQEGIRDWKQNVAEGTEGFFPVHEAWKTFQPVGLSATSESPPQTSGERVAEAFGAELASVLDREITGRMGALDEGFAGAKNSPKYRNDRGVILARFGRYDQARTEFLAAGASGTYVPPMVNLGNLALLKSDYTGALEQFQKALGLHPADPKILVNMVRAEVGLGNVDQAKAQVAELQTLDSNLAGTALAILQVSDTGARAAEVKIQSGDLTWN